jgi:hypothetical protein
MNLRYVDRRKKTTVLRNVRKTVIHFRRLPERGGSLGFGRRVYGAGACTGAAVDAFAGVNFVDVAL